MAEPTVSTLAGHLLAAKYFQLAAFIVLIYDHVLTFSEEVERIWKPKLSGASILFLINRYATPLQFIVIIVAFHDPKWTGPACQHYVAFEGSSTIGLIAVCELVMILRVYALYGRSRWVLGLLGTIWAVQIIVSCLGLTTGFAIPLPPGLTGCIFTGQSKIFPALWVAPLITDALMFLLTLYRSRDYYLRTGHTPTLHIFLRDGTIYFLVISMANALNTSIYFLAEQDLKAIGASFSQLITSTMISRLVLNLRSASQPGVYLDAYAPNGGMKFMTRTIGNLGEEMESFAANSYRPSESVATTEYPMVVIGSPEKDV